MIHVDNLLSQKRKLEKLEDDVERCTKRRKIDETELAASKSKLEACETKLSETESKLAECEKQLEEINKTQEMWINGINSVMKAFTEDETLQLVTVTTKQANAENTFRQHPMEVEMDDESVYDTDDDTRTLAKAQISRFLVQIFCRTDCNIGDHFDDNGVHIGKQGGGCNGKSTRSTGTIIVCDGAIMYILTAAHAIHPTNCTVKVATTINRDVADMKDDMGKKNTCSSEMLHAKWTKRHPLYQPGVIDNDIGLIKIELPPRFLSNQSNFVFKPRFMNLGVFDPVIHEERDVTITGFARNTSGIALMESSGLVEESDEVQLKYYIDTSAGQSGGPVYFLEHQPFNLNWFVMGVHSKGFTINEPTNRAVRLNDEKMEFLTANVNANCLVYNCKYGKFWTFFS